jgi:hypothetical protein
MANRLINHSITLICLLTLGGVRAKGKSRADKTITPDYSGENKNSVCACGAYKAR